MRIPWPSLSSLQPTLSTSSSHRSCSTESSFVSSSMWSCEFRTHKIMEILKDRPSWFRDCRGLEVLRCFLQEVEEPLSFCIHSKLGVPIKTTISANVLEEALSGTVTVRPLPIGTSASGKKQVLLLELLLLCIASSRDCSDKRWKCYSS